jgi:hypothetical protein
MKKKKRQTATEKQLQLIHEIAIDAIKWIWHIIQLGFLVWGILKKRFKCFA